MSSDLKRQHKIDLYLNNTMSASERLVFEQEMSEDSDLREEVLLQKSIAEKLFDQIFDHITDDSTAEEVSAVKKKLLSDEYQAHQHHIASVANAYQKKKRQKRTWLIGAAAAVLLLISSILWFPSKSSYESLYAEYANWTELTSYTEQSDSNHFGDGERLYREQEYAKAIQFFEKFTKDSSQKLYAPGLLYLGASYVGNEELENALITFDRLIQSNSYDRSKGYWYKLLVYLKQGDRNNVDATLELILNNANNFNYQAAAKIKAALLDVKEP